MKQITHYSKDELTRRIVARGEHSGHSHVVVGGVMHENGEFESVEGNQAVIKHLIEQEWTGEGRQVWTGEHFDAPIPVGKRFKIVHQVEFDPVNNYRRVMD